MVMDLSPTVLYKLGFVAGLRYEGETICRKVGLKFIFFDSGSQISLDDNKEILVFRCVQELMRNVVKHAKATEMRLSIRMVGNLVEIALYDNGIGFDPSAHKAQITHPGFGLFSVQERISGIKGNVEIESKIGVGTRIALVLPLD
jgi:two-component system sensor histidine kinase DegS